MRKLPLPKGPHDRPFGGGRGGVRRLLIPGVRVHGPLRLPNPVAQETPLGQNEPEAVRPARSGVQGAARAGLADEPEEAVGLAGIAVAAMLVR